MVDLPDRVSPLDAVAEPGMFGADAQNPKIFLSENLCGSLVQVQAWPDTAATVEKAIKAVTKLDAPTSPHTASSEDMSIMQTGPGRWLIDAEAEGLEDKLRSKISTKSGAVTGLTHARALIEIKGPKAAWVLASGIAIDFDVAAFPIGTSQVSHHHEIGVTIHRTGEESFDLYVFTSFARGFWHWITTASSEVGYAVS